MVTLPLERMASRVAASLCYATGLGHEMVVNSQQVRPCLQSLLQAACNKRDVARKRQQAPFLG